MHDFLKATSLFAPMAFLPYMYATDWATPSAQLTTVLVLTLVLVNSFVYHFMCYLGKFKDLINNKGRRLDQSGQHVVNAVAAYLLSGSAVYFALVAAFATWSILSLWRPDDTSSARRTNLLVAFVLALAPMAWRGDYANLAGAAATLALMAGFFILGGYWHASAHFLLVAYFYFILKSSATLWSCPRP